MNEHTGRAEEAGAVELSVMTESPSRHGRSTLFRRALIAALVGASLWYGSPGLYSILRLSASLAQKTPEERRASLFAPWYAEVVDLRNDVPRHASIDLVMISPRTRDVAVLAGPLLQPRDVRYFDGFADWQARRRAVFLHDDKAANAIPGPPPGPADVTVVVDVDSTPMFRVVR